MTITITTGHRQVTDFSAYLEDYTENFEAAGRGAFSNGVTGDYARSEAELGETADDSAQAYIMRDEVTYSMSTHTLSGSVNQVEFGYGATATEGAGGTALELEQLDYSIEFSPAVTGSDLIYAVINADLAELINHLKDDDILFKGAAGKDVFTGYANDDTLKGFKGADKLSGGKGDDTLLGGGGKDLLRGGEGDDALNGGKGNDKIFGGAGSDTFVFAGEFGRDVIRDFETGVDQLDLSALMDEAGSLQDFKDASREANGNVIYDLGDDGQNVIVLKGVSLDDLSASDFIF